MAFTSYLNGWEIIIVPVAVNGIFALLAWLIAGRPTITRRYPDEVIERDYRD